MASGSGWELTPPSCELPPRDLAGFVNAMNPNEKGKQSQNTFNIVTLEPESSWQ